MSYELSEAEQHLLAARLDGLNCTDEVRLDVHRKILELCNVALYKDITPKQLKLVHENIDFLEVVLGRRR